MGHVVVGVHDGHNAAAAIVRDGVLLYAAQEERFTKNKNECSFPSNAIEAGLEFASIDTSEVDEIAINTLRCPPWGKQRSTEEALGRNASLAGMARRLLVWYPLYTFNQNLGSEARRSAVERLGLDPRRCRRYNHHFGHAATAYYGMREDANTPYLIVTMDGKGDWSCATVSVAEHGRIRRIAATPLSDSMGAIYTTTTAAMGFMPLEHEYKLMGMAAYVAPHRAELAAQKFRSLIRVDEEQLRLRRGTPEPTFMLHRRILRLINGMRFDEVCAGLQRVCEEVVVTLVKAAIKRTGIHRVLCAGGVFMNVKANQLLMELPEVDYLGVPPSCGDESSALGLAWHAYARLAGQEAADRIPPLGSAYLGPELKQSDALKVITESGFDYTEYDDIDIELARILATGKPVARCKGRMEFGARALGNRSILADPSRPDVVRVINQMIKKRDFWMPFAPIMARSRADEFIVNDKGLASPYMMLTFNTTERYPEFIAGVHNADLTARAQILEDGHNDDLARLLKEFEALTGRAVLLNTSFNLHGYPLVNGPEDAMFVFENSGLEYVAIDNYLVRKPGCAG